MRERIALPNIVMEDAMDLYPSIAQRKSCRKYDMRPLDTEVLDEIARAIDGFEPLYPDVALTWRFTKKVKGRFHVDAPHYLIASGTGAPGEMEAAGFLFEQLALWFDAMDIGCVWLGSSKDTETTDTKQDIIVLAFGNVEGSAHRTLDQFKRVPIGDITNAPDDTCIQAVHLAPSGMNTQPWYLEKHGDKVFVYEKKLKPPLSLAYKLSDIDMGIGLCHYAIACKEAGKNFSFTRDTSLPNKQGYLPFGIIE
ncbi:nitroreductase family protein [Raoultibacter phocaeensis]|uniref:nitroreductase family protein n=1 Tax=Raoultibacter phocaeensis TaxID=2479841 RepID=UPI00111B9054|nr:nitroreductase family protein [Raoultibacter phocaeensis]